MITGDVYANLTPFLSVPIPSMWTSIKLPGTRYLGGFMPAPTPSYLRLYSSICQRVYWLTSWSPGHDNTSFLESCTSTQVGYQIRTSKQEI
jgi:hypothetical protein